nr:hypothetical protein [Gemmatimonadales bacterium]
MRSLRSTGAGSGALLASLLLAVALTACRDRSTARLAPAVESRLAAEGIVCRAADQTFRYSFGTGARNAGWEDRRASIVVTHSTVLIHKNEKVGIEITPATAERFSVERSGPRIRIRAGQGRSAEI